MLSLASRYDIDYILRNLYPKIKFIDITLLKPGKVKLTIYFPWYYWFVSWYYSNKIENLFAVHGLAWVLYDIELKFRY